MTKTICVARAASALVDKGAQYLRQKAERYRTLARAALDQYTTQALLKLATEYEARAAEAEIRDSHDLVGDQHHHSHS
jgi:hypothetical protein